MLFRSLSGRGQGTPWFGDISTFDTASAVSRRSGDEIYPSPLNGGLRPRLCEKSDHKETVGKLFEFPLRLAVKRDEELECASKNGEFASLFPTGNMTPDFSHSLGHFRTLAILRSGLAQRPQPMLPTWTLVWQLEDAMFRALIWRAKNGDGQLVALNVTFSVSLESAISKMHEKSFVILLSIELYLASTQSRLSAVESLPVRLIR